jgi:hypothetical protein
MVLAIKWAREQKVPFLGICLGFQLSVIEWARNVLNIPGFLFLFLPSFSNDMTFSRRDFCRIYGECKAPLDRLHARNFQNTYGGNHAFGTAAYSI